MANDRFVLVTENTSDVYRRDVHLEPNPDTTDTKKFSNAQNCGVIGGYIKGGKEDCVDIMRRSTGTLIKEVKLEPTGKFGITNKGGSCKTYVKDVEFLSHGSEVDIDWDNFNDATLELSTEGVLDNVTSRDGKPVTLRARLGSKPKILGGNVKYLFWGSVGLTIYVYAKKFGLAK